MDIGVTCGHRDKIDQAKAVREGNSKVTFPDSEHNDYPSNAMDLIPPPYNYESREPFFEMAGIVKAAAHRLGIEIRWGGNFKTFFDGPHFELVKNNKE